jgi:hypothetical protein
MSVAGGFGNRLQLGPIRLGPDQLNRQYVLDGQRCAAAAAEREARGAGVDHLLAVVTKEASHVLNCTCFAGSLVWGEDPIRARALNAGRSGLDKDPRAVTALGRAHRLDPIDARLLDLVLERCAFARGDRRPVAEQT